MNVGLLGSYVLKAGLIGELVVNDPDAFKKMFVGCHEKPRSTPNKCMVARVFGQSQ